MGITFTYAATTVVGGNFTFEDIYQASIFAGNTYCKKLGTSYLISNDLIVGDFITPTTLTGKNISVTIEGDLFQIKTGSSLNLGTIDNITGSTKDGVFISCPNIANAYGFGCNQKNGVLTKSGDLFAYDSFLDIFGFWGFFGGTTQHCEVIDCLINGFGRIEGPNSKLLNITTQKSHGRFGVIAAKGIINTYENVSSKAVFPYQGHNCSVYFNPAYAPNLRIIGGTYDGYTEGLLYSEPNSTGVSTTGHCTFVDSDIRNGFSGYFSDINTEYFIRYTFNPIFKNSIGSPIAYCNVIITDNYGTEVFNGQADLNGHISEELLFHKENSAGFTDYSYYDIKASYTDANSTLIEVTRRYEAGITYKNFPFFVTSGSTAASTTTGNCNLADIQLQMNSLQLALETKIDNNTTIINSKLANKGFL